MKDGPGTVAIGLAIPTRDRPEFLAETIQSVLAGSRVPEELYVVDNSQKNPSATEEVCRRFGSAVRYLAPVGNLSMQNNHNRALRSIHGELACVLHDDDVYGPTFLERGECELLLHPEADLFAVNYAVIDEHGATLTTRCWSDFPAGMLRPVEFLSHAMRNRSPIHLSASVMRAGAAKQCSLAEPDGNCADMGFFFQLTARTTSILLDEPLVSIRVHGGMESAQAGFFFGGKRRSSVLPLAPLEFRTKDRFLQSADAAQALGEELPGLRRAAASTAIKHLVRDMRSRALPIGERLRLAQAAAVLVPVALVPVALRGRATRPSGAQANGVGR